MCRLNEALSLPEFGSVVPDPWMKAVLVNFRSLFAGLAIGVATRVAVMLPPLGMPSTSQASAVRPGVWLFRQASQHTRDI